MSTGNVLLTDIPTPEQYFQAVHNFKHHLEELETSDEVTPFFSRFEQVIEKFLLNREFLNLVSQTVREYETTARPTFNSDVGKAIITRLEDVLDETSSSELQSAVAFLVANLHELASIPSSLSSFVDTVRLIANSQMDAVDREVLLGYWFICDSAPNHGKLGTAICAVKSAIRKMAQQDVPQSRYTLDIQKARNLWGNSSFSTVSDLFSTTTEIGKRSFRALTHMVGQSDETIRLIAYDSDDGSNQQDIIRFCRPGELLISICHHSPNPSNDLKERIKLQCTHGQLVVGFKNELGNDQVCTLNTPAYYCGGGFTANNYPMIFVKPIIPRVVPDPLVKSYLDNIRTWAVIVNCFCAFPGDYNGQDPLRTRNLSNLLEYGSKSLQALTGDVEAEEWLKATENLLYCTEMVYVVLNLGIHFPLNQSWIEQYGESGYFSVKEKVENKGFVSRVAGQNKFLHLIDISMAPDNLRPICNVMKLNTADKDRNIFSHHMAIQPATFADVILDFICAVLPRNSFGQEIAVFQRTLFEGMTGEIKQKLNYDELPPSVRHGIDFKFQEIEKVLGQMYPDTYTFRAALSGLLHEARKFTAGEGGAGLFVPPSLFMTRTQQYINQSTDTGLLNWQYIGHGLYRGILNG